MNKFAVDVDNVGGIDSLSFRAENSPVLISGSNSTNKTSLLQAISFALGTDSVPIRSGADEASVTLTFDGKTVTRTCTRTNYGTDISGESWLDNAEDKELLEYFAALLEFNPVRSEVRQNGDFEDIVKSPIDLDEIERRQSEKIEEKRKLQRQIDDLEDIEERITECEDELDQKRERAEKLEDELESLHQRQSDSDNDELEELREKRGDLVANREQCSGQIESIESAIDRLEDRQTELQEQIESAREKANSYDTASLKKEQDDLQSDLSNVDRRIDILQSVLMANREMLNSKFTGILGQEASLMEDTARCWTCGNAVPLDDYDDMIGELETLIAEDKRKKQQYQPEIEELEEQISEAESAKRRVTELETEKRQVEEKIDERKASLETTEERLETIEAEIAELDEEIEKYEEDRTSEVIDLTAEIEETRVAVHSAQSDVDRLENRLDELEEKHTRRQEMRTQIEKLSEEIRELTETIEKLEIQLREEFNEAMDELLEVLKFEKIARVWLDGSFDLIIAREIDGKVRQDSLNHLSESEREMVGLVLALAGYITYDLSDNIPYLLLDTLGAFDTKRAKRLIEYFDQKTDYLVVATRSEIADDLNGDTVDEEMRVNT